MLANFMGMRRLGPVPVDGKSLALSHPRLQALQTYWREQCGEAAFAPKDAFDFNNLRAWLGHVALVDVERDPIDLDSIDERVPAVRAGILDVTATAVAQAQRVGDKLAGLVGLDSPSAELNQELDGVGTSIYALTIHQLELATHIVKGVQKMVDQVLDARLPKKKEHRLMTLQVEKGNAASDVVIVTNRMNDGVHLSAHVVDDDTGKPAIGVTAEPMKKWLEPGESTSVRVRAQGDAMKTDKLKGRFRVLGETHVLLECSLEIWVS